MNDRATVPERALVLSYAPAATRTGLAALLALDDTLGQILRTTREPLVGQMRLTWWHDALTALDAAPPPAQPVLQALAESVLPRGVSGAQLAAMIDGWEALLEAEAIGPAALAAHAAARGRTMFVAARSLLGGASSDPVEAAGEGWALADLARHMRDPEAARRAAAAASPAIAAATAIRWSRAGRPLGALAHLARMDLAVPLDTPILRATPRRVARLALHRLTGR
ncbi:squalene/phytoene synthase family protein [Sphingomonas sp. PAMC 26605]|uniref:squalene/phytoene synthase family protein n=1 Tax=Sphingomonas sp. PAMC 26605 TaxID=1112214 RepID=UPI00026CA7BA|nr:squalene/phytoene synthase family protein [Sphingomonas sp. PAMC 26605]